MSCSNTCVALDEIKHDGKKYGSKYMYYIDDVIHKANTFQPLSRFFTQRHGLLYLVTLFKVKAQSKQTHAPYTKKKTAKEMSNVTFFRCMRPFPRFYTKYL